MVSNSPPKLGGVPEGQGGSESMFRRGNHPASLRSASPPNLGGELLFGKKVIEPGWRELDDAVCPEDTVDLESSAL